MEEPALAVIKEYVRESVTPANGDDGLDELALDPREKLIKVGVLLLVFLVFLVVLPIISTSGSRRPDGCVQYEVENASKSGLVPPEVELPKGLLPLGRLPGSELENLRNKDEDLNVGCGLGGRSGAIIGEDRSEEEREERGRERNDGFL